MALREELDALKIKSYPKTTGSRGIHIYMPIVRGPLQKEVWTFAKAFAIAAAQKYPKILTSEYRVAKRSPNRILVDYNQNAWGRHSGLGLLRAAQTPRAGLRSGDLGRSQRGIEIEDFRLDNMEKRLAKVGDLYRPLLLKRTASS